MRLSDLTPEAVGAAAHKAAVDTAHRIAFSCGYDLVQGGAGTSDLAWACRWLTLYAQTGRAPDDAPASEYYLSLLPLYSCPTPDGETGARIPIGSDDGGLEPTTPWGLVLRACWIRDRLAAGEDVTPSELACLASISPQAVRQLIAAGELRTRKRRDDSGPGRPASLVTAAEARRWLSGRGVLTP